MNKNIEKYFTKNGCNFVKTKKFIFLKKFEIDIYYILTKTLIVNLFTVILNIYNILNKDRIRARYILKFS